MGALASDHVRGICHHLFENLEIAFGNFCVAERTGMALDCLRKALSVALLLDMRTRANRIAAMIVDIRRFGLASVS